MAHLFVSSMGGESMLELFASLIRRRGILLTIVFVGVYVGCVSTWFVQDAAKRRLSER